ncbi:hypothetical protein ACROYT_G035376 [Oculina patagonica]
MESVFVRVPKDLKGYVIGKGGCKKNEIMQWSGAIIRSLSREEEGFTVSGDPEQIAYATTLILDTVEEARINKWELVEIPDEYKGRVIGKSGARLDEISKQTGVSFTRKGGEVYITYGTEQQRQHARVNIGDIVATARLRGVENEFFKARCYIDGRYLPENCKLKLEKVPEEDHVSLPGPLAQFRLKPVEEEGTKDSNSNWSHPNYQPDLENEALDSLRKIKYEMNTTEYPKADMWCHLGTSIVRGPDDGSVHEETLSIDEATEKLQSDDGGRHWRVTFRERVDLQEDIFERNGYQKTSEDNAYIARYDLTYLTPCFYRLRCKIWVAKESAKKKLDEDQIPFSDVKNKLEEIHFEDVITQSRSRAWLVLKSRKYLQCDILFPGCLFDCRLTIRGRTDHVLATGDVPELEVRRRLSTYLSGITLAEEDGFGLRLPERDLPEGFYLTHKRCCRRTTYSANPGFSIILSKENTWWRNVEGQEESRESTDLHLHCEECDQLLSSNDWEPEIVARKLPSFIEFVMNVQCLVVTEMKKSGSTRTIPPEILARGALAREVYNNALAEGKTCVKRVPLMAIGQDRSGKTSLKKSLKGIRFNPEEDSTVGIDVDRYDFEVTTEMWVTGKKDEEAKSDTAAISFEHNAARLVAERLKKEESATERVAVDSARSFDSEITDMLMETYLSEPPEDPAPIDTPDDTAPTDFTDEPHLQAEKEPDTNKFNEENDAFITTKVPDFEDIADITEKLLQHDVLEDGDHIYSIFWDFAGQSVYYVTHPLFLTARAIYFLVYDLSQNPHGTAKPLVKQGVYKKFEDSFNLKKNVDYLDFWMTSVASLARQDESNDVGGEALVNKFPSVFLVCTHADKPHDGRDPRELAVEIFGSLKDKPYGPQLSDVFVVDNTKSGSELECGEVTRLREAVLDVAKELPHINEAIPVKWLRYEKALQIAKIGGYKCISLAQARHIASEVCNIYKDDEILTLLNFLHDLRILIHFNDTPELDNVVVLDPQWLIDVFKKVITVRPYDTKEKGFLNLWCKLEKEGILEEKLLEHVWDPLICQRAPLESLIAIMEKFSLLCPWPSLDNSCNKQYLVPSMLKSHPPKAISDLVASAQIPSLFLKFKTGQVPAGLFSRLVLEFFQWCNIKFPQQAAVPQFFNNFARFYILPEEGHSVVLLCHSLSVEILVLSGSEAIDTPDVTSARGVRDQLASMIDRMRNKFFWVRNVGCEMSFLCPVCCQGRAVNYCRNHHVEGCKQEECLHFFPESKLCNAKQVLHCTRSATAQDNRVTVKQFAPWLPSGHEKQQVTDEHDGGLLSFVEDGQPEESPALSCNEFGSLQQQSLVTVNQPKAVCLQQDTVNESTGWLFPFSQGHCENSLTLPGNVLGCLQAPSYEPKDVVVKLLDDLQLEHTSLEQPDPETRKWIRCLARNAKWLNRLDVVKYLRQVTPAGTTGPLLEESIHVLEIPQQQRFDLTVGLSSGDEWKLLAERLGLTSERIRFLDKRLLNPADALLVYVGKQCNITVGDLYALLNECKLHGMADRL